MRRTKQTQNIINSVNEYLKNNHVKTTNDIAFIVISYALLKSKIYEGFNEYTIDGKLSGGINTDYIQLY